MKLEIPKIVRTLDLGQYADEIALEMQVWVNPPAKLLLQHDMNVAISRKTSREIEALQRSEVKVEDFDARLEALTKTLAASGAAVCEVMAELWSQGTDVESRWTAADVKELINSTYTTDPGLYTWMHDQTMDMIQEHRTQRKKV